LSEVSKVGYIGLSRKLYKDIQVEGEVVLNYV